MDSGLKEEVKRYIERSEETLTVARLLLHNQKYPATGSRAYFVMFYAVCAVVRAKNLDTSKHSGVISLFGCHFAKDNIIDPRFHKMITKTFDDRDVADYSIFAEMIDKVAEQRVADAEAFLQEMKRFLQEENWLDSHL